MNYVFLFFHSNHNLFIHIRIGFEFIVKTLFFFQFLHQLFVTRVMVTLYLPSNLFSFVKKLLVFLMILPKPINFNLFLFLFFNFGKKFNLPFLKFFKFFVHLHFQIGVIIGSFLQFRNGKYLHFIFLLQFCMKLLHLQVFRIADSVLVELYLQISNFFIKLFPPLPESRGGL